MKLLETAREAGDACPRMPHVEHAESLSMLDVGRCDEPGNTGRGRREEARPKRGFDHGQRLSRRSDQPHRGVRGTGGEGEPRRYD
jgi:hypothetical protein